MPGGKAAFGGQAVLFGVGEISAQDGVYSDFGGMQMRQSHTISIKETQRSVPMNLLIASSIVLIAALICDALYRIHVAQQNIIIVMVCAVFINAAITDGYFYGIAATLVGVFVYDFLVTYPRLGFSFTIGFPATFLFMLAVTLITSTVTVKIKNQVLEAREKEYRAELLYEVNRTLFSSHDKASVAQDAVRYMKNELHRSAALFIDFNAETAPAHFICYAENDVTEQFFLSAEQQAAVLAIAQNWDVPPPPLKEDEQPAVYYSPVVCQGALYGVFVLSCAAEPLLPSHMAFIDLIVGQTAQALRICALSAQQRDTLVVAEREKIHNSFLRGISHDLRTPLTSIIGASSTFLETWESLDISTQLHLIEGIQSESQWLLSMVENILSITRIHQSGMSINKNQEMAEEVVGEAVAQFRKRWPDADITIYPPKDILLIPMDVMLITQVLNNLLDNTQRHTGQKKPRITVRIRRQGQYAEFIVTDNGPGINEEAAQHLFKIQPKRTCHGEDASRGLGMGLSLCKTIVEAHQGYIDACNLPDGGAQFRFALPIEEVADNEQ